MSDAERWAVLRKVITGLLSTSGRLAAQFPGSDEPARADTFARVLSVMDQLECPLVFEWAGSL